MYTEHDSPRLPKTIDQMVEESHRDLSYLICEDDDAPDDFSNEFESLF